MVHDVEIRKAIVSLCVTVVQQLLTVSLLQVSSLASGRTGGVDDEHLAGMLRSHSTLIQVR